MALLDESGAGGYLPSEPSDTSSPSLPAPPFDIGNFLNSLSTDVFGTSPRQVGQASQNAASDLSSFPSQLGTRGALGTDLGEALFPHANEGLQVIGKPLGQLAQYDPKSEVQVGQDINQVAQGVAGATDTETNSTARNIASYGVGLPQALAVAHGGAEYAQGLGNLFINAPQLETELQSAFTQGLKGTFEQTGQTSLTDDDTNQAVQKLLDVGSKSQAMLFNQDLMQKVLYNSFKSFGADDTLAGNTSTALAGPINALAPFLFGGDSPVAMSMMATFVAGLATDPRSMVGPLFNTSPSYDFQSEQAAINADVQRANNGELSQDQLNQLQQRIDNFNAKTKDSSAGQLTTGDFLKLLGESANMTRGGTAPSPNTINRGLTSLVDSAVQGFMLLHGARTGAHVGSVASNKWADWIDRSRENVDALEKLNNALTSSTIEASGSSDPHSEDPLQDAINNRRELSSLKYAIQNLRQTTETGTTGQAGQAGEAAQAGEIGTTQAAGRPGQILPSQSAGPAAARYANEGLPRAIVSETNAQSVPITKLTLEATNTLNEAKQNLINKDIPVRQDQNISSGWLLPDGTSVELNSELRTHSDISRQAFPFGTLGHDTSGMNDALQNGWVRIRSEMSQPDPSGKQTPEVNVESGPLTASNARTINGYLMANVGKYRDGTVILNITNPETASTRSYEIPWNVYQAFGDIRTAMKQAIPMQEVPADRIVAGPEGLKTIPSRPEPETGLLPDIRHMGKIGNVGNVELVNRTVQISIAGDFANALHHTVDYLHELDLADNLHNIEVSHDPDAGVYGWFDPAAPANIDLNQVAIERTNSYEAASLSQRKLEAWINTLGDHLTDDAKESAKLVMSFINMMKDSSQAEHVRDIAAHEALHLETWNIIKKYQHPDDGLMIHMLKDPNIPRDERIRMGVVLLRGLEATPEGRAWLNDPVTQNAVGRDISDIRYHKALWDSGIRNQQQLLAKLGRDYYELQGLMPKNYLGGNELKLNDLPEPEFDVSDLRRPYDHLNEFMNYQLNWIKGGARHPLALQSGDNAYAETLFNFQGSQANARLAETWFDSTRGRGNVPLQSISGINPSERAATVSPGAAVTGGPTPPANASNRDRNATAANQTGVRDFRHATDEDRNAVATDFLNQATDLRTRITAARARGDINAALNLEVELYGRALAYNKILERMAPRNIVARPATPPVDYESEALRLSGKLSPNNFLAPLKDVATQVSAALENFNRAQAAGMNPADLLPLQKTLQFSMARFRSAYDLYNSDAFKVGINKNTYDWKGTRDVAKRVMDTNLSPREKALLAVRLFSEGSKKPMTLQDAGKMIRDTSLGISKDAKSWHPDFKKLLAGEMWNVVSKIHQEDPALPIGIGNIPVHELIHYEDLQGIHDRLKELESARSTDEKQFQVDLQSTRNLEKHGKIPLGSEAQMIKDRKKSNLDFSNQRAMLNALIDNHPDSHVSRVINSPLERLVDLHAIIPTKEDLEKIVNQPNPNENKTTQQMINEAKGIDAKLSAPAGGDPFSLETFLREGPVHQNEPITSESLIPSQPWFTPRWAEVLTKMRELGGDHKLAADLVQDLMVQMANHLDPTRNMWHPKQWFKAHWEALVGIPQRVHGIQEAMDRITGGDIEYSKAVLSAIDSINDVKQRQAVGHLSDEQAALANFLNEYWRSTQKLLLDPKLGYQPLIAHFIDNYIPHVILKDPNGNVLYDAKKAQWSNKANAAKQRMLDGKGNPVFQQLQDFENGGYEVEWNLSKVFGGHANSVFRMMKIREMFNTLGGMVYRSPDGSFVGHPVIRTEDLDELRRRPNPLYKGLEIFDTPQAKVRWGPGDTMFQGYKVHPELAREIEKLANMQELPMAGPARFLRNLGGLFKLIEFSLNPRHAFNVYSNVANLYSPAGVVDPRTLRNIYGRANRALQPEQQGGFFKSKFGTGREYNANVQKLLNEQAALEKEMNALHAKMQAVGDDPYDLMPWTINETMGALRDQFAEKKDQLLERHRQLDALLGDRDRRTLGSQMDKGLVPDRELMEGADLNALSNYAEKIPGLGHFHRWMWRDVVWRGQIGVALHLADVGIMKRAKQLGWDGKGGAATAEKYISSEMLDGIHREAVVYAKQATGLLNKLDMSQTWQLWGRAMLLSAPWTMGQLQATRDMFGGNFNNMLRKKVDVRGKTYTLGGLAGPDFTHVTQEMMDAGFGKEEQQFLDSFHTHLARRMILHGTAKLAMTSFMLQALGTWMYTGQIGNPITNFMRDPVHMFDIYTGKDPATGADHWIDNPFFGFQHEMINYVLAGLKSGMEGDYKGMALAPLARFTNKENPVLRNLIDLGFGIETSRWLAGLEPGMDKDTDLHNLHRALTGLGAPDWGSMEDRILYFFRNALPRPPGIATPGFPTTAIKRGPDLKPIYDQNGQEIPLTDPKSLLNDFGFGGALTGDVFDPSFALSTLGVTQVPSSKPLYDWSPSNPASIQQDPNGFFPAQAKQQQAAAIQAQDLQAKQALVQIGNLAASDNPDDWAKIAQIRDQMGLTDNQVTQAVMYGASVNINGRTVRSKGLGASGVQGGSLVTINGDQLTQEQSVQYNKVLNNNELYAIEQLKQDPEFQDADGPTKAMLMREFMNSAGKFTTAQAGQQFQGMGGEPLTNDDYKTLVQDMMTTRQAVYNALLETPEYQAALPNERIKMYGQYITMTSTLAWDRNFGNLKGLSTDQLSALVDNSVLTDTRTQAYLQQTPFYQTATPDEQVKMEKTYSDLAKQMNINVYNGTTKNMVPYYIPSYMQAVINTEETAKYLLHQSDFYQTASLAQQQAFDSRYQTYARQLAQSDWSSGKPLLNLNSVGQSFAVGSDQVIVGRIMSEQGYTDLQNQYGGSTVLNAYAQQETQIRKEIRSTTVASPATINRLATLAVNAYENSNPQYKAFKKARSDWEKYSTMGRLYAALNADDTALANTVTTDLTDPTTITNSLDVAVGSSGVTPEEAAVGLG